MQGNDQPMKLYTIDVDSKQIEVDEQGAIYTLKEKKI